MDDESFSKVRHSDVDLVACDYNTCSEFGEYTTCYLDPVFKECVRYKAHLIDLARNPREKE